MGSGSFEGDLIRPLGLVTLYFGHAEFAVNALLASMKEVGLPTEVPAVAPFGQKVACIRKTLGRVQLEGTSQVIEILEAARPLIELRNSLVHSCIVARGRVKPNDGSEREFSVTPQQLTDLADQIFTWKERLSSVFQRQLLPALRIRSQ